MNLRTALTLAIGLSTAHTALADDRKVLREECTATRCVYYDGSTRVFSVERERNTSRVIIRNPTGKIEAKVRRNANGTVIVEKPDSRR